MQTKRLVVELPASLKKRLAVYAAKNGKTQTEIVNNLVAELLTQKKG